MTYTDVLIYCPDTPTLVAEVLEKFPTRMDMEDPENPKFLIDKSNMTIRNGAESLTLGRINPTDMTDLQTLDSIQVLGTYDQVFADPALRAIYDRVYDQTPVEMDDGEGGVSTYTPSEKFVVFQ